MWLLSGAGLVSLLEFCNKRFETRQHSIQSSGEKDPVGNLLRGYDDWGRTIEVCRSWLLAARFSYL